MKKESRWQISLGVILVLLSASVYFIHYLIFRDAHHIFIYLIGDIGFVFLEVLIVTLVIHRLLLFREKQALLNKLNMVIGVFFSEAGNELLKIFAHFLENSKDLEDDLQGIRGWDNKQFLQKQKSVTVYDFKIDYHRGDFSRLKEFLLQRRTFLLNLLENPNIMEHESFTNCLWAVFHLAEELSFREDLKASPEKDLEHLSHDVKRAYKSLVFQWLAYMKHLKEGYPYLFSLAIRTNPFDQNVTVLFQ